MLTIQRLGGGGGTSSGGSGGGGVGSGTDTPTPTTGKVAACGALTFVARFRGAADQDVTLDSVRDWRKVMLIASSRVSLSIHDLHGPTDSVRTNGGIQQYSNLSATFLAHSTATGYGSPNDVTLQVRITAAGALVLHVAGTGHDDTDVWIVVNVLYWGDTTGGADPDGGGGGGGGDDGGTTDPEASDLSPGGGPTGVCPLVYPLTIENPPEGLEALGNSFELQWDPTGPGWFCQLTPDYTAWLVQTDGGDHASLRIAHAGGTAYFDKTGGTYLCPPLDNYAQTDAAGDAGDWSGSTLTLG